MSKNFVPLSDEIAGLRDSNLTTISIPTRVRVAVSNIMSKRSSSSSAHEDKEKRRKENAIEADGASSSTTSASSSSTTAGYEAALSALEIKLKEDFPRLQLAASSEDESEETGSRLTAVDQAEARLSLITASLSAYCGYLLLKGTNPAQHAVVKQLQEAKSLLGKLSVGKSAAPRKNVE